MSHRGVTLPETYLMSLVQASFEPSQGNKDLLRSALSHEHPRARVLAMRGLARGNELTTTQWELLIVDSDPEVRRETLSEMGTRGECPIAVGRLVACLRDQDPLVAEAAAFAVGECGVLDGESELKWMLAEHEDARCRETAVVSLGLLACDSSRQAIIEALSDKPTVRRRAIVALASFEGSDIDDALDAAANDRDWQVRSAVEQLRRDS